MARSSSWGESPARVSSGSSHDGSPRCRCLRSRRADQRSRCSLSAGPLRSPASCVWAGNLAAFLSGAEQPTGGLAAGLGVFGSPADPGAALGSPGLNAVAYWAVVVAFVALLSVAGWWVWRVIRNHTRHARSDPNRIAGIATSADVRRAASDHALLKRRCPPSRVRRRSRDPRTSAISWAWHEERRCGRRSRTRSS